VKAALAARVVKGALAVRLLKVASVVRVVKVVVGWSQSVSSHATRYQRLLREEVKGDVA